MTKNLKPIICQAWDLIPYCPLYMVEWKTSLRSMDHYYYWITFTSTHWKSIFSSSLILKSTLIGLELELYREGMYHQGATVCPVIHRASPSLSVSNNLFSFGLSCMDSYTNVELKEASVILWSWKTGRSRFFRRRQLVEKVDDYYATKVVT